MCHPAVFGRVSELATRDDLPVAMHLAGSREEYYFVKRGSSSFSVHGESVRRGFIEIPPWLPTGVSPVRYALNWGAFESPNVLAVHCVHTDEEDVKKLKEYNVAIAVCPRCNAQLGMGVAPSTSSCAPACASASAPTLPPPPTRPTCSPRCASACSSSALSTSGASSIPSRCSRWRPLAAPCAQARRRDRVA